MPDYETLDTIADAYTPLLAFAALAVLVPALLARQWREVGARMASLAAGALVAYGLMFLDDRLRLWPAAGLDYSTHTAVALVLGMFLSVHSRRMRPACWASLSAYALLMVYQGYHSAADILTTAVVVGVLYLPAVRMRGSAAKSG